MSLMTPSEMLAGCQFVALRYEGLHVECTGITAVAKQELRVFNGRGGVVVTPWSGRMASAKSAIEKGLVTDTGLTFPVAPSPDHPVAVRALIAQSTGTAPNLFLTATGDSKELEKS